MGYLFMNWSTFPNKVPTHYSSSGVANDWGSKNSILLVPICSIVLYVVLTVVSIFPSSWNVPVKVTKENRIRVLTTARTMLCMLKLILVATFSYISICTANAKSLSSLFLLLVLIATFLTITISIVLIVKNSSDRKSMM